MKYRTFGRLSWKVSALGFGAMRLPVVGGNVARIDEAEAIRMIRYAIDHGVNYIDTAYPYHGGTSEVLVGKALRDGYREKIKLATKMPTWLIKSQSDMDKYFSEQLDRLQLEYVDFYLLQGLNAEGWNSLKKLAVMDWAERKISEGKIQHLGFSFHDEFPVFKEIIDSYSGWSFCQIQYNYLNVYNQAGTKGLKYAASKGLAVVVMEPLGGGRLAMKAPEKIQTLWQRSKVKKTPAEWALMWVWNHAEVSVVLSGMSSMQQVVENVESAGRSGPNCLSEHDLQLIAKIRRKYRELSFVGCTNCKYCIPCPEGVDIPSILSFYNEYFDRDRNGEVRTRYLRSIAPKSRAERCGRCGKCEELCPQKLSVREVLIVAAMIFEQDS